MLSSYFVEHSSYICKCQVFLPLRIRLLEAPSSLESLDFYTPILLACQLYLLYRPHCCCYDKARWMWPLKLRSHRWPVPAASQWFVYCVQGFSKYRVPAAACDMGPVMPFFFLRSINSGLALHFFNIWLSLPHFLCLSDTSQSSVHIIAIWPNSRHIEEVNKAWLPRVLCVIIERKEWSPAITFLWSYEDNNLRRWVCHRREWSSVIF